MPPERVGTPRQNERGPGVLDNGHQHRRSDNPPARWQAVGKISRQKLGRLGMGHLKHMPDLRSEEHTSELQSLMRKSYAVFCLKKKTIVTQISDAVATPHCVT